MDARRDQLLHALLNQTLASVQTDQIQSIALDHQAAAATALATLPHRGLAHPEEQPHLVHAASIASAHATAVSQLQSTLASVANVSTMAMLHQRISEYDTLVAQGSFSDAAVLIQQLQQQANAVHGGPQEEGASASAVNQRLQLLTDFLSSAPPQYLSIDPATYAPSLIPPLKQTASALAQVWEAAATLGVLPSALLSLSTTILDHCITPILLAHNDSSTSASAAVPFRGRSVMESPAGSVASSALSAATAVGGGGAAAAAAGERALYRCFKSLCEGALGNNEEMIARFGHVFWPPVASSYISIKLAPAKPSTDAELAVFMRAGSLAIKLEQKAVKLGLWPSAPPSSGGEEAGRKEKEGPISKFVRVTIGRMLANKRIKYASAARDLLTSSTALKETTTTTSPSSPSSSFHKSTTNNTSRALFTNTSTSTSNASAHAITNELKQEPVVGDVGTYIISRAAEGLTALMHEALSEACRSGSAALAQAMCGAVIDLASLFLAVVHPTTPDDNDTSTDLASEANPASPNYVPFVAAVRYNDCMHIYRTLCILPQLHAPRLQALVHPALTFAVPARRVRASGEALLSSMVAAHRQQLLGAMRELRQWQGLDGPGVIRCNKTVRQVLGGFQRLGGSLYGVLPRRVFVVDVAAHLANVVCETLADDILSMGDISADESEQIPRILGGLTAPADGIASHVVSGCFPSSTTRSSTATLEQDKEWVKSTFEEAAVQINRLQEVCHLLDIPSREIAMRWRSGRLAAVGLTKQQVVDMVRALFEDNEFSRASLQAILQSSIS